MKRLLLKTALVISLTTGLLTAQSHAASNSNHVWRLSESQSKLSYTSIKKNSIGENNHFKEINGYIDDSGNVLININVTSVETFIDIRNQRTIKHIFDSTAPTAMLKTRINLQKIEALEIGKTTIIDISGTLNLSGNSTEIETAIFIARLGKNRFLASTDSMIMVKTTDLGIDDGVNKLMKLAKLNSIARVVPVSFNMVFNRKGAASAKIAKGTTTANKNLKVGEKLFRQCQACHQTKSKDNGIGPHLAALDNRKAGSISGFNYSEALKNSNIVWSKKTLREFLANPQKLIPGNNMPFNGIKDTEEIESLTTYLLSL